MTACESVGQSNSRALAASTAPWSVIVEVIARQFVYSATSNYAGDPALIEARSTTPPSPAPGACVEQPTDSPLQGHRSGVVSGLSLNGLVRETRCRSCRSRRSARPPCQQLGDPLRASRSCLRARHARPTAGSCSAGRRSSRQGIPATSAGAAREAWHGGVHPLPAVGLDDHRAAPCRTATSMKPRHRPRRPAARGRRRRLHLATVKLEVAALAANTAGATCEATPGCS